jgi:hypothetical protein
MTELLRKLPAWILLCFWIVAVQAEERAPWGSASLEDIAYAPHKVVYDVAAPDVGSFSRVLDRVSYLNNIYRADPFDASIVVVLHGFVRVVPMADAEIVRLQQEEGYAYMR